jgi:hypothetical protein
MAIFNSKLLNYQRAYNGIKDTPLWGHSHVNQGLDVKTMIPAGRFGSHESFGCQ